MNFNLLLERDLYLVEFVISTRSTGSLYRLEWAKIFAPWPIRKDVKLSTTIPTYCTDDQLVSASMIEQWARRSEIAGFDGLWALDHIVKPNLYNTSVFDPLSTLNFAAAVTDNINLGTSIFILPLRYTADVASRALTLQHLAGGNVTLGLGTGYVPEEFEVTGIPIHERGPRLSEGIEVLQILFEGKASFEGRFHSFKNIKIDPVLDSPPNLLAGGGSKSNVSSERSIPQPILDRILDSGGWIAPPSHPDKAAAEWELISKYARRNDVNPNSLDRVMLNYAHLVDTESQSDAHAEQSEVFEQLFSSKRGFDYAQEHCLVGTIDEVISRLDAYNEIGFDEVILGPPANDSNMLERQLDLFSNRFLINDDGLSIFKDGNRLTMGNSKCVNNFSEGRIHDRLILESARNLGLNVPAKQ